MGVIAACVWAGYAAADGYTVLEEYPHDDNCFSQGIGESRRIVE